MTGDDDRPRRDGPPRELELELADVPRRLPRGAPPAPSDVGLAGARPAPAAPGPGLPADLGELTGPPPGRALLDEPSPWPRRILTVAVLAGAAYLGYRVYRRFFAPDIVAIGSPYHSSAGVTIALPPGGGWHTDRRLHVTRENGPGWLRADVIFRGSKLRTARELAVLVRVHGPGAFARSVDRETFRSELERSVQQQAAMAGATVRNLNCVDEDTWQSGLAEVCYGRLGALDRDIGAGAYLWIVGDDDLIGIVYATEDASLDALEVMAKSAR